MPDFLTSIFTNYETSKLPISNPSFQNTVIFFIFFAIALVFAKRKPTTFLDPTQTNELKGLAMLMVVTGHLWVHVAQERASLILSDNAVSLFLILSGFGLSLSVTKTPITLKRFIFQRLSRVMIPYWIITGIILLSDYLVLNKIYSLQSIFATLVGINIDPPIQHLDYARWFITLLLVEYVVFFVAHRFLSRFKAMLFIGIFGVLLMFLNQYKIFQIGSLYHLIAFPLGCLLAYYLQDLTRFIFDKGNYFNLLILLILSLVFMGYILAHIGDVNYILANVTRTVFFHLKPLLYCFLAIFIIGGIGRLGFVSGFLTFSGVIALEIYLIHGPLLIKYNPVLGLFLPEYIVISFSIFLIMLFALSYGFNVFLKNILVPQKFLAKNAGP